MEEKDTKQTKYRNFTYSSINGKLPSWANNNTSIIKYLDAVLPRKTEYAFIWHDKDRYNANECSLLNADFIEGGLKPKHLHIVISLAGAREIKTVANYLNVPENQIQKVIGKNGKNNMFSYLCHRTLNAQNENKFQYDLNEVVANFDYKTRIKAISTGIKSKEMNKDEIHQKIFNGDLRFIDFMNDASLNNYFCKNKTFISTCFDARYKKLMNKKSERIFVYYIEGKAGSGKTNFGESYAIKQYRDFCSSSMKNDIVQDYLGQDVMIFDDARPTDFRANEWLKILDPFHNQSTITSRYYNKYLAVKCILVTSTIPFEQFFLDAYPTEDQNQWWRRFDGVFKFADNCRVEGYSEINDFDAYEIIPSANRNDLDYELKFIQKGIFEVRQVRQKSHLDVSQFNNLSAI